MIVAAANPRKIFLLEPLDSAGALAPPKVNVGPDPAKLRDSLGTASNFFARASTSVGRSGETSATRGSCLSRAGAGALAAPPLSVAGRGFEGAFIFGSVETKAPARNLS